jgi:hypothetical protein
MAGQDFHHSLERGSKERFAPANYIYLRWWKMSAWVRVMLQDSIDDLFASGRDNEKKLAQYVDFGPIQSSC